LGQIVQAQQDAVVCILLEQVTTTEAELLPARFAAVRLLVLMWRLPGEPAAIRPLAPGSRLPDRPLHRRLA